MDADRAGRPNALDGPFLYRIFGAIFLRDDLYRAVAADKEAWRSGAALVCLAAIAQHTVRPPSSMELWLVEQIGTWSLPLLLLIAVARWLVYSGVLFAISRLACGSAVSYPRLLRCLGFAEAPALLILFCLFFETDLNLFVTIQLAISVWLLAATVVAVRAALAINLQRAVPIGVVGFVAYLAIPIVFPLLLGMISG